jgi:hypothetical protein
MFASWKGNIGNADWWKNSPRTTWQIAKPHGDGLLMYPGPGGTPISSLRLEALRDGIEEYEYLVMLYERAKTDFKAAMLLQETKKSLVTGVTSYNNDPRSLLDLRKRIALYLGTR